MMDREKWQAIILLVPRTWLPLMEQARGDTSRAVGVRDLIRDALKVKESWPIRRGQVPRGGN